MGGGDVVEDGGESGGEGGGCGVGVGTVEEEELQAGVEVAAEDGDETVEGFLGGGGGEVEGAGVPRVGVAEVLEGRAIGGVVVPDCELEEGGAEEEEELGFVAFFEGRLGRRLASGWDKVPAIARGKCETRGMEMEMGERGERRGYDGCCY